MTPPPPGHRRSHLQAPSPLAVRLNRALQAFGSSVEGDLRMACAVLADGPPGARGSLVGADLIELAGTAYSESSSPSAACWQSRRSPGGVAPAPTRAPRCPTSSSPCISSGARFQGSRNRTRWLSNYSADGIWGLNGRGRAAGRGRNAAGLRAGTRSGSGRLWPERPSPRHGGGFFTHQTFLGPA